MNELAKKLLEIKDEIEEMEKEQASIQGRLKELLSILNNQWGCSSVEEAEKKLKSMVSSIDKKEKTLNNIRTKLDKFGWSM